MDAVAANSYASGVVASSWDVVVIGAGPAGSMAARAAALAGLKTLLVECRRFPRDKVCGGYLNRRATMMLAEAGLQSLAKATANSPPRELAIVCGEQRARFPLPLGKIICRREFDSALLDAALSAGATIRTDMQATIQPTESDAFRTIVLTRGNCRERITAKVVICADGLARSSSRQLSEFASSVPVNSRVGIGAVVGGSDSAIPANQLMMVVTGEGYIGISRVGQNRFNVAAAINPQLLLHSAPIEIAQTLLREACVDLQIDLRSGPWRGTPELTSRPHRVASNRIFLIGDASGYVEPFTGEGISSALETAIAVTPFAAESVNEWNSGVAARWTQLHQQIVIDRQQICRQLSWVLRRPWAASAAVHCCRMFPGVARRLITKTSTVRSPRPEDALAAI
jgi:flavin-dependent dehydrogenase